MNRIITLEDVLEALLQEQIYDESDKYEREALRLSGWVVQKWKAYTRRKKRERSDAATLAPRLSLGAVVVEAMDADERTGLLEGSSSHDHELHGFLTPMQGVKDFFDNLSWPPS